MKSAQKLVSLLFLLGFFAVVSPAKAAQLLNMKLTLGDSRPTTSNTHTFEFTHKSSATIRKVTMDYCTTPSGFNDACSEPASLVTTSSTKGALVGLTDAAWTLNRASNGHPVLHHVGAGQALGANLPITIPLNTVTNHGIDNCQAGGDTSTDTCYVRVRTYTTIAGVYPNYTDEGVVSYTVVSAVTVTARVDPSFTFVVEGVNSNLARGGVTTSAASTYNTIPFGNMTAGTARYVSQGLRVTTNTQSGYTVTMKMETQMTGNYTMNNIDPFIAPWSAPTVWGHPNGTTPNDNSGWIGANTTDTDVAGWGAAEGKFGTVSSTAYTVMQSSSSDNGSNPVYVTFAIEANVFQPADTYSGTLLYNALPTY